VPIYWDLHLQSRSGWAAVCSDSSVSTSSGLQLAKLWQQCSHKQSLRAGLIVGDIPSHVTLMACRTAHGCLDCTGLLLVLLLLP
jgi:hypothetical protein